MAEDSDEDAWLQSICRAPRRRPLPVTLSDASDDAWLQDICHFPRTPESSGVPAMVVAEQQGGGSSGVPVSPVVARAEEESSGPPQSPGDPQVVGQPFVGPYHRLGDLVSELVRERKPLPSVAWSLPEQDTIIEDDAFDARHSSVPVIQYCLWRIAAWGASMTNICIFKVGVAYDPHHRWHNAEFGYDTEKQWMFMDVMHAGTAEECCVLEKDLIARLKKIPGCRNEKDGGDGICLDNAAELGTCHLYVVFAPAGEGINLYTAWRRRKRASCLQDGVGSGVPVLATIGACVGSNSIVAHRLQSIPSHRP